MRKRTDQICMNVFSMLHETINNGVHIVFSKTDYLHYDLQAIARFSDPCIVICGNSDYCIGNPYHPIGENLADFVPENVLVVFCQNCLVKKDHQNYDKFISIPIGIENYISCKKNDYGSIPINAIEKYKLMGELDCNVSPINDQLYSNFLVRSNCQSREHRELIRKISIESGV